jgi:DNA primase
MPVTSSVTPSTFGKPWGVCDVRKLEPKQRQFLETATATYQEAAEIGTSPYSTRAWEYLLSRGFDVAGRARYRLGVVDDPLPGHEQMQGRIVIPYLTPTGVVDLKFRCIEHDDCKANGCIKYLCADGGGNWLYNARAVLAADDTVVLTEGEFDAMAAGLAGVPAVGYPGTDTWSKNGHWPRVFAGLEVVVVADGDKAGVAAAKTVAKSLELGRVVRMPAGEDPNSALLRHGAEWFREKLGLPK